MCNHRCNHEQLDGPAHNWGSWWVSLSRLYVCVSAYEKNIFAHRHVPYVLRRVFTLYCSLSCVANSMRKVREYHGKLQDAVKDLSDKVRLPGLPACVFGLINSLQSYSISSFHANCNKIFFFLNEWLIDWLQRTNTVDAYITPSHRSLNFFWTVRKTFSRHTGTTCTACKKSRQTVCISMWFISQYTSTTLINTAKTRVKEAQDELKNDNQIRSLKKERDWYVELAY